MRVEDFLSRLEKVRRTAGGWIACCPAHDDHTPSLTVSEGADGRLLVHCFGGCSVESVVGALGLTLSDIMPEGPAPMLPVHRTRLPATDVLEAMAFNALTVAILAADMAKGRQFTEEEKDKLFAIAGSFQEAMELTGSTKLRDQVLEKIRKCD